MFRYFDFKYFRTKAELAGREFSILFFMEGPYWIAMSLEKAMVSHGLTKEEALQNLRRVAETRVEWEEDNGREKFSSLQPSDRRCWHMYNSSDCGELPKS